MPLPTVSVLVARALPGDRAAECLESLKAQTYPSDRFTVHVSGTTERAKADYIALVADDVTTDPGWLEALVSTAESHRSSAVAGTVLESDRRSVHFAGRDLSFVGLPSAASNHPRLLYPSRQSALVRRTAFIEAGGLDATLDGCLDDVDLGWRLNLLGHAVVPAPDALAFRRAGASQVDELTPPRRRIVERNALAMIFRNYDARTLERVFPAAVALSLFRGLLGSGIDALTLELSTKPPDIVQVDPRLIAHLIALEDFTRELPALQRQRAHIQRLRRQSDLEILPLFGDALRLEGDARYEKLARTLIQDLGIEELFQSPRAVVATTASIAASTRVRTGAKASESAPASGETRPRVSIVILTAIGPTHLPECLESIRRQTYPSDRIEVIVVDNGSAEDPTAEALRAYPGARVILNGANRGFAGGNNVGAEAATGDYLVFLNDDTRVEPTWLEEMMATARRRHAAAVSSFIVDWSGTRVDFVDAAMNFQGKGFQLQYDDEAAEVDLEEKPLIFACGCAVLIDRAVFVAAGGWDEGTFAYYEDVELGWRLNLLGHGVWFSPASKVYHKHHGTSDKWPEPPRVRLYERNSLRMVYALLDRTWLQRALPVALLLAADRALLGTPFSRVNDPAIHDGLRGAVSSPRRLVGATRDALRIRGIGSKMALRVAIRRLGVRGGINVVRDVLFPLPRETAPRLAYDRGGHEPTGRGTTTEAVPIAAAATLSGIFTFLCELPSLARRRAIIQAQRAATDADIFTKFGSHWLQVCPAPIQFEHDLLQRVLVEQFRLAGPGGKAGSRDQSRRR